jgi:hypothetical protein
VLGVRIDLPRGEFDGLLDAALAATAVPVGRHGA